MAESDRNPGIRGSVSAAGARIQELIDTAERVATEIEADARAEARLYSEKSRREADDAVEDRLTELREVADPLIARVEEIRRLADELTDELHGAVGGIRALRGDQLADPPAVSEPPTAEPSRSPLEQTSSRGPVPVAYPGLGPEPVSPQGSTPDEATPEDALLRATQLAVSGSSRAEIEDVLRSEFEIADPSVITDEILGPDQGE